MAAFRPVLGAALVLGTWWASTSFVPALFTSSSPDGQVAALRGTAGGSTSSSSSRESAAGFGVAAPLGIALLGLAAMSRNQRSPAVSRQFFSGTSAPVKEVKSYKDYKDPWLNKSSWTTGFLGTADLNFDPLNFATGIVFDKGTSVAPATTYYNYRESEVKHGRFAMAAFLAIFFEDVDREALFQQLGFSGAVDNLDATLGLDQGQGPVLLLGIGAQALAEYSKQRKENDGSFLSVEYDMNRCPGDLGFDPLAFGKNRSPEEFISLHNGEVNMGRLAMIGVTAFLYKEFLVKDLGIVS